MQFFRKQIDMTIRTKLKREVKISWKDTKISSFEESFTQNKRINFFILKSVQKTNSLTLLIAIKFSKIIHFPYVHK